MIASVASVASIASIASIAFGVNYAKSYIL
jgi:hypothetical protein